ncbi:hypothetical protein L596_003906 [Steinernema carpocapsae]|uniref:Uncharacterized protein n=1 Tax=Steinernema carpocapsae TaxID=34508 RepID=A0A4U8UY47_STECR|nr:hypothetical protein L596_003906 [Steinernema carpocapsae]
MHLAICRLDRCSRQKSPVCSVRSLPAPIVDTKVTRWRRNYSDPTGCSDRAEQVFRPRIYSQLEMNGSKANSRHPINR